MCSRNLNPRSPEPARPGPPGRGGSWVIAVLLALPLWLLAQAQALAGTDGSEVVLVYARNRPESRAVAEHYARARNVPESNWIGLETTTDNAITRTEYIERVQKPLLDTLSNRGLLTFTNFISAATNGHTGGPAIRCTGARVRYLVLCWGMPFRIIHDPQFSGELPPAVPAAVRRNDGSIDSELTLLPSAGGYRLVAGLDNPFYKNIHRSHFHPTNGVLMVGRLDGPSPAIARSLVDKALSCETNGFAGNAYFDLRNITTGNYRTGDEWLTNAAATCRRVGIPTLIDNNPATFPPHQILPQIGIYMGWYTGAVDGPFTREDIEFMPGAIAYHLHSFNGTAPRNPASNWVGPLLARGATVTFGSVDEPFLEFTPNAHVFIELLTTGGFTIGEAALASQPWLSWMNVFYGDPLFVPFQTDLNRQENQQLASGSPNTAWTVLRKANVWLVNTNQPSAIRESLVKFQATTNHSILCEKVAALYADAFQPKPAILWARKALDRPTSPHQRARILLNLAEWYDQTQDAAAALDCLLQVEDLRTDYRDLIPFKERQLQLARDAGKSTELARIKETLNRLREAARKENPPR